MKKHVPYDGLKECLDGMIFASTFSLKALQIISCPLSNNQYGRGDINHKPSMMQESEELISYRAR